MRDLRDDLTGLRNGSNGAQFHLRTRRRPLPGHQAGQRRQKRGQKDHQLQARNTFADETGIP
jgi:hypothetical protein